MTESLNILHDAIIRMIYIGDDKEVRFSFKTETDQWYTLKLIGVLRLRCDNLLEGNIVLDVSEILPANVSMSMLAKLIGQDPATQYPQSLLAQVKQGGYKYIEINPSYGCTAVCLCKEYLLQKGLVSYGET